MPVSPSIVIAGSLAQKPNMGGHAWVLLQYLLGFQQLGWDVLFLDRLDSEMCVDKCGRPCGFEESDNRRYFVQTMREFGFEGSYSLDLNHGERTLGLDRESVIRRVRNASLLLNVMGFLDDEAILAAAKDRVFLDIDPGFGQLWHALDLHSMFDGHDQYVTIGENIGNDGCALPTCDIDWIKTPPPVVLDHWPTVTSVRNDRFTTVASWRGAYGPVEYEGKTYGLRVHEFRRFAELPRLSHDSFEMALNIHPDEHRDLKLLRHNHWNLVDPRSVAGSPRNYRNYVQGSMAEFSVAKNMYVQSKCGWFSDRSICYLASGKPVLVQDTGLTDLVPTGEGLLIFHDLDEALRGVDEIRKNYARHSRAARRIAEQHFHSNVVLSRLLQKLGK